MSFSLFFNGLKQVKGINIDRQSNAIGTVRSQCFYI
jgi:hypothetical protein